MRSAPIRRVLFGVLAAAIGASTMLAASPAGAVPGPVGNPPTTRENTDIVMTGTGAGQGVSGGIAPVGSGFDPLAGYPADVPAGFDPLNEGFAGVITAQSALTGDTLNLYCIDIRTTTYPGIGYENGTWDASNVPNVGYVARILNEYYPTTAEPAAAPNDNARAAAVQGAIWFFTDSYVISASDPEHQLAAGIVAAVIAAGPLVQPPPPSLTIDPSSTRGPAGAPLGPFTVSSDAGIAVSVSAAGATMFADEAAATPIANGDVVPLGQQLWLVPSSPGASGATLSARGVATAPTGNVYLYDGNTVGVDDAQRLILAQTAQVATTTDAAAEFFDTGALTVTKTITGPAAGAQGPIVIETTCNGTALDPFVIPAGTTGTQVRTYTGIETPATCAIAETASGLNGAVSVATVNPGQTVTLPDNSAVDDPVQAQPITDTYDPIPGSLIVTKTIAGSAAGQQGPILVRVSCANGLQQDIAIPAGATGDTVTTITGIPAGTTCTISEPVSGATSAVGVVLTPAGAVTIPAGGQVAARLVNTITAVPPPAPVTPVTPDPGPALANTGPSVPLAPVLAAGLLLMSLGTAMQLARRR